MAILVVYRVSASPPGLHPREVVFSVAKAEVFVDSTTDLDYDGSNRYRTTQYQTQNVPEALTLAEYLQTQGPLERMAGAAGVPGKLVSASGPFTDWVNDNEAHLVQIAKNHRLLVDVDGVHPMLTLYGQAPTEREAIAIVDSAWSAS